MKTRMELKRKQPLWLLLSLLMVVGLAVPQAFATIGETDAGTPITNTATISYVVNTVLQDDVDSNDAEFLVDHKVRPVVGNTPTGSNTEPNSYDDYLTFTVTNDGNTKIADVLDIQLTAVLESPIAFGVTDILIYVEDNGSPGLQHTVPTAAGDDSIITGTIGLARDTSATIYVVGRIDGAALDSQTARVYLVATAWSGAAALDDDDDGDAADTEEVVFADDAGTVPAPTGPDDQYDGRDSDSALYTIVSADLGVAKSSTVVNDPFGGTYRVPGARVRYVIDITNSGAVDADNVVVVDPIPDNTRFFVGSVAGGAVAYSNDDQASWAYGPSAGGDGSDPAVTDIRVTLAASIADGGGTAQVTFDVLID